MKKIFLLLMVSVFIGGSLSAQDKKEDRKKGNRIELKKALNLTDEQEQKIGVINQEYKAKHQNLREQQRELGKAHKKEISEVLTADQQAKMKELNVERANKMKGSKFKGERAHVKHGKGKGYKFDAETQAKLKTLRENYQKEVQAVDLSRIAPDAQAKKKEELKEKYRADRKQIVEQAKKTVKENS